MHKVTTMRKCPSWIRGRIYQKYKKQSSKSVRVVTTHFIIKSALYGWRKNSLFKKQNLQNLFELMQTLWLLLNCVLSTKLYTTFVGNLSSRSVHAYEFSWWVVRYNETYSWPCVKYFERMFRHCTPGIYWHRASFVVSEKHFWLGNVCDENLR